MNDVIKDKKEAMRMKQVLEIANRSKQKGVRLPYTSIKFQKSHFSHFLSDKEWEDFKILCFIRQNRRGYRQYSVYRELTRMIRFQLKRNKKLIENFDKAV